MCKERHKTRMCENTFSVKLLLDKVEMYLTITEHQEVTDASFKESVLSSCHLLD